ncbi:MAG: hypothetical protein H0X29_07845, partial [Parachlamydiaceae bacterium]|nr:hypothetical protein [Parachlamydiaceae bacterium]
MGDIKNLAIHAAVWGGAAHAFKICDPKDAVVCSISTCAGILFASSKLGPIPAVIAGNIIGILTTDAIGFDVKSNSAWFKLQLASIVIMEAGKVLVKEFNKGLDPTRAPP